MSDNVVSGGSWDFVDSDTDPTESTTDGGHGTSVAGIVAGKGWNDVGIRGVAPDASLKGFNWLKDQNYSNFLNSFGGASYSQDVDVFNFSAGCSSLTSYCDSSNSYVTTALNTTLPSLRGGKGAVRVKSSGNSFDDETITLIYSIRHGDVVCGNTSSSYRLSCNDGNSEESHHFPINIVVGSLNADGTKSSYSTPAASIWVSGYGGEYGVNTSYIGSATSAQQEPAVMTVDKSTCSRGVVSDDSGAQRYNSFNDSTSPHSENASCNYTSTFNGTSAAAPTVTGVIAMMLEANPNLTWRDVKHILASNAVQVDTSYGTSAIQGITFYEWITNAAGFKFHNYYGFGAVNAAASVSAAASYSANTWGAQSTETIASGTINYEVEDLKIITFSNSTTASGTIEFVKLTMDIVTTANEYMSVRLQSPSGTMSTLMQPYTANTADVSGEVILSSNAFYGENLNGTWKLIVTDHRTDSQSITVRDFQIEVLYR
jgi:subtilisin-like proprotein convertase family protein